MNKRAVTHDIVTLVKGLLQRSQTRKKEGGQVITQQHAVQIKSAYLHCAAFIRREEHDRIIMQNSSHQC